MRANGADLDVVDWDAGEPVVFVQSALTADELVPLARQPALAAGFRKIVYHRRGYGTSSPAAARPSITLDAADLSALIVELGIDRAHIVSYSYSAAVAMQVAVDDPRRAHSLVLIEPPPVHTRSADDFRAANDRYLDVRRTAGAGAALEEFLSTIMGPTWRDEIERTVPDAIAQMEADAATFFDADVPAMLSWTFDADHAARITCPVLYVGGTDSGPWFAHVRELLLAWLPHAEDVVVDGADHGLAVTHATEIAEVTADFLKRHPVAR